MKRILIVEVNWIGDCLFSTPFIRALRQAYPDSYIACLLHPRCREILEDNPRANELILYDEEGKHRGLLGKLKLINYIRRQHFDTAFILHRSFTKALLTYLAGIKKRIGYPTKKRSLILTKAAEEPAEELHKVEYFLNILQSAGIQASDKSYEFFIKDADRRYAKNLLLAEGISDKDVLITICPGGNWDPKRWPKENFARISDTLSQKFGAKILITGAAKDAYLADDIRKLMKSEPIIAAGKTTLKQLAGLLELSGLVIANDTGSMHLAVAMGAPTIALFGPTSPDLTGPRGRGSYIVISKYDECDIPCYDVTCKNNRCMAAISVEDVLKEAEIMMGNEREDR